jgi:hypothetical protein
MSRLRDFGRDAADYFGIGEGSDRVHDSDEDDEPWVQTAVGIVLILVLAFVLRGVLGFDDDFVGYLVTLGIAAILASALGLILRLAHRGTAGS